MSVLLSLTNTEPFKPIYNTDILNEYFAINHTNLDEVTDIKKIYLVTENELGSIFRIYLEYQTYITGIGIYLSKDGNDWKNELEYIIETNDREIREIYLKIAVLNNRYFIDKPAIFPNDPSVNHISVTVENEKGELIKICSKSIETENKIPGTLLLAKIDEDNNIISDFKDCFKFYVKTNDRVTYKFHYRWFFNKRKFKYLLNIEFYSIKTCSFSSHGIFKTYRKCLVSAFDIKNDERNISQYYILYKNDERDALFSSYDLKYNDRTSSFSSYIIKYDERNISQYHILYKYNERNISFCSYDLKYSDRTLSFDSYTVKYTKRNISQYYILHKYNERNALFSSYDLKYDDRNVYFLTE